MASQVNFTHHSEEVTPTIFKLFQKTQQEERLPSSFFEASIILIPKPDIDSTKKENYRPKSLMNTDTKFSTKYEQTESSKILKSSYTMIKWDLFM